MKQKAFFKLDKLYYGGTYRNSRKGRKARPISCRDTMHLILKSSRAKGAWSFRAAANKQKVIALLAKFAAKNGIVIHSIANANNHLHVHLRLTTRHTYRAFIRAVTAAIAMAITGASRWKKLKEKFWDYRPFTRVVKGRRGFLTLRDYIHVNQIENAGATREEARKIVAWRVERGKTGAWEETA